MSLEKEEHTNRELLKKDPKNIGAWANLGKVLCLQEKFDEGNIAYKKALELKPDDTWLLYELSLSLCYTKNYAEAEEVLKKLLKINPEAVNAWFNLALIYHNTHNWKSAEEHYRKALEIDESYINAYINLGQLLDKDLDDKKAAADVFLTGFEKNPYSTLLLSHYYKATETDKYVPAIVTAIPKSDYSFDKYRAVIIGEIEALGKIQYDYVLLLYKGESKEPIYFVALERNTLYKEMGPPSHFLCAFDESRHVNFGGFESNVDLVNFTKSALEQVGIRYNIQKDDLPEVN
ncbi:MAG: tetratricopeptide repeat protein [Candidatus Heimdallarchaeota archaeon]